MCVFVHTHTCTFLFYLMFFCNTYLVEVFREACLFFLLRVLPRSHVRPGPFSFATSLLFSIEVLPFCQGVTLSGVLSDLLIPVTDMSNTSYSPSRVLGYPGTRFIRVQYL